MVTDRWKGADWYFTQFLNSIEHEWECCWIRASTEITGQLENIDWTLDWTLEWNGLDWTVLRRTNFLSMCSEACKYSLKRLPQIKEKCSQILLCWPRVTICNETDSKKLTPSPVPSRVQSSPESRPCFPTGGDNRVEIPEFHQSQPTTMIQRILRNQMRRSKRRDRLQPKWIHRERNYYTCLVIYTSIN